MFFRGSRYQNVPVLEYEASDGRIIRYKARRVIPPTPELTQHVVDDAERLDHIAFEHFRDSERFWRLTDANLAVHPESLIEKPGRILDVPSSEG